MEKQCNHDMYDENTTLVKSPKKIFIHPAIEDYYCTICKKAFKYQKDDKGILHLVKE